MKKKEKPIALVIAVVALVLAIFSTYSIVDAQKNGYDGEAFKASVFSAIDDYVAEKTGQPTGPVEVSVDDDPAKGDKKAPVTIVEFTDYQCPYCKRYATETMPEIMKNYVDTGKVRYVVRDFPLNGHLDAGPAANAAECLREQGGDDMYFDYHDVLFANNTELSLDKLKEYAASFNIDQTEFATCVDEERYASEIAKDFQDGQKYGVRGTPAFFINGEILAGAQPYANFEAVINKALEEK